MLPKGLTLLCYIASDAPVKIKSSPGLTLGPDGLSNLRSGYNLTDRGLDPPQSHITFHLAGVTLV